MADESVTDLLAALQAGRPGALDALIPVVYDHLRAMAAAHLARGDGTPTLQPTALVHELYFKLVDQRNASYENRVHFFATASMLMRRLIVDHARRRDAAKRGGDTTMSLDSGANGAGLSAEDRAAEVVRVHEALEALEQIDPRQARVVELRFFGGLTNEETAEVLDISLATVKRDWAMARAWLHTELAG